MHYDDQQPPHPLRTGTVSASDRGPHWLEPTELLELVRLGPLVSIDLVVQDPDGRILVGLRNNEPAKDTWFVPGGRVGKGEPLDMAFRRIIRDELGLARSRSACPALGVFEHFYSTNFREAPGFGTHYIVLAHLVRIDAQAQVTPDAQHRELRWLLPAELTADAGVHRNTKVYGDHPLVAG